MKRPANILCRPGGFSSKGGRAGRFAVQRGVAMVEFALVLPLFVILLLGFVDFALALHNQSMLINASRTGARAGIVLQSPKLTEAQIRTKVLESLGSSLIACGAPTVTAAGAGTAYGNTLTVDVSATFQGLFYGSAYSAIVSPITLRAYTVMMQE